jgi:amino acid adenylation domain-containing protein
MKKSFSELPNKHQELFKLLLKQQGLDVPKQEILPRHAKSAPLSYAQQRLWFLAQLEGGSGAYHIPFGWRLQGDLDRSALVRALDRLVARHESLRTRFVAVEGEPEQRIAGAEESGFHLQEHDLREHAEGQRELERVIAEEARTKFDLEAGPLIRGRLIRMGEQEHVLLITMHHIVSDGWSMGVLFKELSVLYGVYRGGEQDRLPELGVQYADYAVWQRRWMEGETFQEQAEYWRKDLGGIPELLEVPADHPRPAQQEYTGAKVNLVFNEELSAGVKELSQRQGMTLYMTLLAGWAALLGRLSGAEEVVIGTPVANRGHVEIEGLIGFFVNTLAIRVDLSGRPTVKALLGRVKEQVMAAQHHQDIPFEQVVEIVGPVRSLSHSPVFQVLFVWQNAPRDRFELAGVTIRPLEGAPHVVAKFDLTLALQEAGERIVGGVEYATSLFEQGTVERYLGYLRTLLQGMVADPEQVVDRLAMLGEEERAQVLYEWNETGSEYAREVCIQGLFEEQVERRPEAIAVEFEEARLSYGELNRRANRLAHYLRGLGVKPDVRVAMCVERGLEMMVGLLAVLKAGGAYVPLDPRYPEERLHFMLTDSAPAVLLTQGHLERLFVEVKGALPVIDLGSEAGQWTDESERNPEGAVVGLTSRHLAYVIYTSGSTGTPKGVAIEHRSAVNFIQWAQRAFSGDSLEHTLFSTSLNFDLAVYESLVPMSAGCTVRIVSSVLELAQTRLDVTLINTVPSAMKSLLEMDGVPPTVRTVNLAGEPLKRALVEHIFARTEVSEVCNLYGPTESTTYSTWVCMGRGDGFAAHIGRPIANTRVYILDAHLEPVAVGVAGELYIGGAGVARGYQRRAEQTGERFVPDPYGGEGGGRMYRTGDIGRWQADGVIEFLGRNDDQVKVRGYRIELGEIEARLGEHAGVREAVVVVREDRGGDKRLVAYYTSADRGEGGVGVEVGVEELRRHLVQKMPEYMVPAAYVRLESLPLTPNGKLDHKALPVPEGDAYAVQGYEAPQGEIETQLAAIWAELLKIDRVGRHDNFFSLGGHSLLSLHVASRIRGSMKLNVPVRVLFENPTVARLAATIESGMYSPLVESRTADSAEPAWWSVDR